jgi:tetratricopeptide (TPR) repeat protein
MDYLDSDYELTDEESNVYFLNSLMKKHRVAFAEVGDYKRENTNQIMSAEELFDLDDDGEKTERQKQCLALLYILDPGNEFKAVKYFREVYGLLFDKEYDTEASEFQQYIDDNKIMLITSLMYNPVFRSMAMNFNGFIRVSLQYSPFLSPIEWRKKAANEVDKGFKEFDKPIQLKDGTLRVLGDKKNNRFTANAGKFWAGFKFNMKKVDDSQLFFPRLEEQELKVGSVGSSGSLSVDSSEYNQLIISVQNDKKNDPGIYNLLGIIHALKDDDLDDAVKNFTESIEIDPRNANVYFNRAMVYGKKNEFSLAVADFEKVLELNIQDKAALYYLALSYLANGDAESAINKLNTLLDIDPDYREKSAALMLNELIKEKYDE